MQDINIDQGELETLIAIVSPKFGSKETAIFTDLKGDIVIKNRGESITGWYPILTLEGLEDFKDFNNKYPSDAEYDAGRVASSIVSEGVCNDSIRAIDRDGFETEFNIIYS
jgi:hypothetical protein